MSKGLMGEFNCKNKDCKMKDIDVQSFYWTDDSAYPKCESCKEEMQLVLKNLNQSPSVLKFNSMSSNQKRGMLKERSNKHFHKRIEEKQREMLRPDTL